MNIRLKSKTALCRLRIHPRKFFFYEPSLTFVKHAGRTGSSPLLTAAWFSPFWGQATAILHYLGIDSICMWMSVDNEEISLAVCNLLQTITDCLLGQGKEEQHGKEEALVLGNGQSLGLSGETGAFCSVLNTYVAAMWWL